MKIFAEKALLGSGWAADVTLRVEDGCISNIDTGDSSSDTDHQVDTLLPALSNLHSHSFQRAMAGMSEYRAKGRESFWTWRGLMYRYLDQLTPEHISAIAELAFIEMMEAGYAAVGEFHYLHHAPNGAPYDDLGELSLRIMEAAKETGLGLTHLPVQYGHGGADGRPLEGGQKRFGNDLDRYLKLLDRCDQLASDMPSDTVVGIAPHSLRAVAQEDLASLLNNRTQGPVHIHIAEQVKEVEEITANLGARPVEWLLDNAPVDARWCLIHATHMSDKETSDMAKTGAVAGLCPVTEANLGDGVFNGAQYLKAEGQFGVGTDSNINIALSEELRVLEYSQRLTHRARNVLTGEDGSTGETLYLGAARGGAQALDRNSGEIAEGKLADLVAIDTNDPRLCLLKDHQILDGFIFAANDGIVTDLWSAGRHMVRDGRHIHRDRVRDGFRKSLKSLQ